MDGPDRLELFNEFQVADGFEILHRDTLVVLGTTGEDLAGLLGVKGGERRVGPFVGSAGTESRWELKSIEGREGLEPGQVKRRRSLLGTNSRILNWRPMD